ncbi:PREDICTED: synaptobrevin homolog YKT6-like [Acropora digitifera]|uniref:synaptobrevin homolog YKT6-like n=1 Tax=Acropora digitifera TaxID=70779 RepID=UPI00077A3511|nr:PREDICTED: synaptobrevin homolog YKT6-like [Acropora digitifera]
MRGYAVVNKNSVSEGNLILSRDILKRVSHLSQDLKMKLYALSVVRKDFKSKTLVSAFDLQSFGYFQRSSVKEFMQFTSQILVERTREKERASVKEQEYVCHVFVRSDSLGGVIVSDLEYPQRVVFTLLNKVLDDFSNKFSQSVWKTAEPNSIFWPECEKYLEDYQNPRQADAMTKVQAELDETKIVLHNTIETVLQRGEKLDDLVEKSEGLTLQSKAFYKTAKKTNSCCSIQ